EGLKGLACLVLAGLVSAAVAAAMRATPLIPIVFATAGCSALADRAKRPLVLDEVGTALNLVARAPRHDRHELAPSHVGHGRFPSEDGPPRPQPATEWPGESSWDGPESFESRRSSRPG